MLVIDKHAIYAYYKISYDNNYIYLIRKGEPLKNQARNEMRKSNLQKY